MSKAGVDANQRPVDPPGDDEQDLPDWLKILKPTEPAAEPPMPAAKQEGGQPAAPVGTQPEPTAADDPDAAVLSTGSLVGEDDLPDWLKALTQSEPKDSAPTSPAAPHDPAPVHNVPSWAAVHSGQETSVVGKPPTPEEAPPVWTARRPRRRAGVASDAEALLAMSASSESTPQPAAPSTLPSSERASSPVLRYVLLILVVVIVLAVIVGVVVLR